LLLGYIDGVYLGSGAQPEVFSWTKAREASGAEFVVRVARLCLDPDPLKGDRAMLVFGGIMRTYPHRTSPGLELFEEQCLAILLEGVKRDAPHWGMALESCPISQLSELYGNGPKTLFQMVKEEVEASASPRAAAQRVYGFGELSGLMESGASLGDILRKQFPSVRSDNAVESFKSACAETPCDFTFIVQMLKDAHGTVADELRAVLLGKTTMYGEEKTLLVRLLDGCRGKEFTTLVRALPAGWLTTDFIQANHRWSSAILELRLDADVAADVLCSRVMKTLGYVYEPKDPKPREQASVQDEVATGTLDLRSFIVEQTIPVSMRAQLCCDYSEYRALRDIFVGKTAVPLTFSLGNRKGRLGRVDVIMRQMMSLEGELMELEWATMSHGSRRVPGSISGRRMAGARLSLNSVLTIDGMPVEEVKKAVLAKYKAFRDNLRAEAARKPGASPTSDLAVQAHS
jgi:hypothetical protein